MTGPSETSGTLGVGTGAVGLALVTASGLAVFGLAEYGPGIGTAALVGFGVVALALAALGAATDVTDWGVAIPVGLVWVALVVVGWMDPEPPLTGLTTFGFVGLFLAFSGVVMLISLPLARRMEALGAGAG